MNLDKLNIKNMDYRLTACEMYSNGATDEEVLDFQAQYDNYYWEEDLMNKKKGTNFENEFCDILAQHGFWARKDKGYAQTCDILASKNNISYLFECKTCSKDYFSISRVEDNQNYSRSRFRECGNSNCYFVYKLDIGEIYISQDAIKKPSTGQKLEEFLNDNK